MKKSKIMTHAPTENKVHIITWSPARNDFWTKELPYNMTDDEIYKWIGGNVTERNVLVYRGRQVILRGRR